MQKLFRNGVLPLLGEVPVCTWLRGPLLQGSPNKKVLQNQKVQTILGEGELQLRLQVPVLTLRVLQFCEEREGVFVARKALF